MKLGRRPSFKRTRPMLQHPSPETIFNQQTISVYERPASMKNWRPETMLSQDCSLDCQGIRKWRVQRSIIQVQKHYDFSLKTKLGRRPSFKRTSPMLSPPSPETSSNQQTISVYEQPASMKNWRLETMLSQDCSGFKRTSPMLRHPSTETIMISYWKWSWAEGPASKGQAQCSHIQVWKQAQINKPYQFTSGQLLWRTGV